MMINYQGEIQALTDRLSRRYQMASDLKSYKEISPRIMWQSCILISTIWSCAFKRPSEEWTWSRVQTSFWRLETPELASQQCWHRSYSDQRASSTRIISLILQIISRPRKRSSIRPKQFKHWINLRLAIRRRNLRPSNQTWSTVNRWTRTSSTSLDLVTLVATWLSSSTALSISTSSISRIQSGSFAQSLTIKFMQRGAMALEAWWNRSKWCHSCTLRILSAVSSQSSPSANRVKRILISTSWGLNLRTSSASNSIRTLRRKRKMKKEMKVKKIFRHEKINSSSHSETRLSFMTHWIATSRVITRRVMKSTKPHPQMSSRKW